MALACCHNRLFDIIRGAVGACGWLAREFFETLWPQTQVTVNKLVARLATDCVELAQFRDRQTFSQVIGYELCLLIHRCSFAPGHRAPPWVPDVFSRLLPMSLD